MAPVLAEWIPEGDLAHFVSDLVESGTLDLRAIYDSYEDERGFPPYDPRLMVKLLIYGYANGVMSSRKLERATYRDVAVRMLCADQHPDYRSIAGFASGIWGRWGGCSCRRSGCASGEAGGARELGVGWDEAACECLAA